LLDALGGEHDVVAGVGVVVGFAGAAVHDIVANDGGIEEQISVVAGDVVELSTGLDPVVTLVAKEGVGAVAALYEVVPRSGAHLGPVRPRHDEILSTTTEVQGQATAGVDDIVALIAVYHVHFADISPGIGNDVVAFAAVEQIHAITAFDTVVILAAPNGIVAFAGNNVVVSVRTHHDDMAVAVIAQ